MTMAAMRHWPLPDTHNVRDLGGYARKSGGNTQWGRLLRGEALHPLSRDSIDHLVAQNLALVIDLRGPHETGHTQHPFRDHAGVAYRNIPLFDVLSPIAMAKPPFDMTQRYRDALDKCGPRLAEVFRAIITASPGVILFHCTAGKDRTGIVAALLLLLAGVERNDVAEDYALTAAAAGLIAPLRARALAAGGEPDHVDRMLASDAATMLAMLDHLDVRHGGIHRYLAEIGLAPGDVDKLRDRLCA